MSNGDPIGSEKPRGKSNAKRMGRYDGSYTPSEQRKKDELMRQFMRTGEGPGAPSEAYRNASCWCACGRLKADGALCSRCEETARNAPLGEHPLSQSLTLHGVRYVSDPRMEGSFPVGLADGRVAVEMPSPGKSLLETLDAD